MGNPGGIPGNTPGKSYGESRGNPWEHPGEILWGIPGNLPGESRLPPPASPGMATLLPLPPTVPPQGGTSREPPGESYGESRGIPGLYSDVPGMYQGCTGRAGRAGMYRGCTGDVPGGPGVIQVFTRGFTGGPWRWQKLAILSKFRHFIFQVVARGFDLPGTPESPGNPRGIPVQAPPLPSVSGYGVCGRDPPCGAGGARWWPGRGKWGAVGSGREFPVYRGGGNPGESYGESYGESRGNPMEPYWGIPGEIFIFFPATTVAVQGGSRGSPGYYTGYAAHPLGHSRGRPGVTGKYIQYGQGGTGMAGRGTVAAGLGACAACAAYPSIGLRGELEGRVHRRLALRGIVRQWLGGGSGAGVRFSVLPGGGVWYGFRAESGAVRGRFGGRRSVTRFAA